MLSCCNVLLIHFQGLFLFSALHVQHHGVAHRPARKHDALMTLADGTIRVVRRAKHVAHHVACDEREVARLCDAETEVNAVAVGRNACLQVA